MTTESSDHSDDENDCTQQSRLGGLFVRITGTEELVEKQQWNDSSRVVIDEEVSDDVSKYLVEMAREDGLSETLSEPERDENFD